MVPQQAPSTTPQSKQSVSRRAMQDKGRIKVMLKSKVKRIGHDTVVLDYEQKEVELPNEAIIVCAGGILPTPFLNEIDVMVKTKFGTA